jgi:hypothetical protein
MMAAKEVSGMVVPLTAAVMCRDGFAGHLRYLIVNPLLRQVTHLVIEEPEFPYDTHLTPLGFVQESTRQLVRLRCSEGELEAQESFLPTEPQTEILPYLVYTTGEYPFWLYVPGLGLPTMPPEYLRLPDGGQAVQPGTPVRATNGNAGCLTGFIVAPRTGAITQLIVSVGHLWRKRDLTLPISALDRFQVYGLCLKVDKQSAASLERPADAAAAGPGKPTLERQRPQRNPANEWRPHRTEPRPMMDGPDFARGERTLPTSSAADSQPDFARGLRTRPGQPAEAMHPDFARGLRRMADKTSVWARPDFARGQRAVPLEASALKTA